MEYILVNAKGVMCVIVGVAVAIGLIAIVDCIFELLTDKRR